jgi:hypothetical protein
MKKIAYGVITLLLLPIIATVVFLLIPDNGGSSTGTSDSSLTGEVPDWDLETCMPPCWNGITPGVTTVDELMAIANSEAKSGDIKIHEQNPGWEFLGDGTIEWHHGSGSRIITYDEKIVVKMIIEIPPVCLGEFIERFGSPSHVEAFREPFATSVAANIYWLTSGFEISITDRPTVERGVLDDRSCQDRVQFFMPSETLAQVPFWFPMTEDAPVPWHGYDTLENYLPPGQR